MNEKRGGMTNTPEDARRQLLSDLRRYFVGPLADDEEFTERPPDRYHCGILYPKDEIIDAEEDENSNNDDSGDNTSSVGDGVLYLANQRQQSAMGFTFQVEGRLEEVKVSASWARYVKVEKTKPWRREAHQIGPLAIADSGGQFESVLHDAPGVSVLCRVRSREGVRILTLSMLNTISRSVTDIASDCIYQPQLLVESADQPIFVTRPPAEHVFDDEFWNFELLYRNSKHFAVGHGCSVEWTATPDGQRAAKIWTEWLPHSTLRKADADVLAGARCLDLEWLANEADEVVLEGELSKLTTSYRRWLEEEQVPRVDSIVSSFPAIHQLKLRQAAEQNLRAARTICERIERGIKLIGSTRAVREAFQLSNSALASTMRKRRPQQAPSWRAFQLAFILLAIPSTSDPDDEDRNIMDLIWFPTGGGKTEAYLGLTAFAMFLRRLTYAHVESTVVITRYTLRLLTIQQFERAAQVICGCELIRLQDSTLSLGKIPFTIGLFLGNTATPDTLAAAQSCIDAEEDAGGPASCPLVRCPWCGERISAKNQIIVVDRLVTKCPNPACEFRHGLPFTVVDEEIYAHPPTFVIGTVDKFAVMPWRPQIRSLFALDDPARKPPTLVIQDELHLISDALGTITALYEIAFDALCVRAGWLPKVIGSTATIRRAGEQTRRLFDRTLAQFPPSVLDIADSFFYRDDREAPGRMYVGVHAQGRSPKHTLARALATTGQLTFQIEERDIKDPLFSLVAYFNSLRELGGAIVLAEDDVPRYLDAMPGITTKRRFPQLRELTSALPQAKIPEVLDEMAIALPKKGEMADAEPLDIIFATNMISVGVDVDRLGLMLINGQPKSTSEYIQASSRIGRPRSSAGIVIAIYNWTRPRDRSHYERFCVYHQAIYRHVEAATLTPFASRARDKALHGVLFALCRAGMAEFSDPASAGRILQAKQRAAVEGFVDTIVKRAADVEPDEMLGTQADLAEILSLWEEFAQKGSTQWTGGPPGANRLMRPAGADSDLRGLFPTPTSMRDVEPACPVRLPS
jgi:hypothetical protein